MNLWVISATATPFIPPWPFDDGWQTSLVIASVANVVRPIPLQNISILGKTLGSDGNLYLLLPDNANLDATPTIAGAPDCYTFTVTAQKYGYSGNFVATQAEAFS
jgi:hypothetical protein